ncbi:MAG: hypothetical protein IPI46_12335 [Bacteroidetes bacterium]|nr:hypothetical protein [Bacteroidota bacterium]
MATENTTWKEKSTWDKSKEILGIIGNLAFITMLILNLIALKNLMKSNNYNNEVVGNCMTKYSKIASNIRAYNNHKDSTIDIVNTMYDYFDLTNEELFYIRNGVVNPEVSGDWITGMIKQIKIFKEDKNYNTVIENYPRIKKTFLIEWSEIKPDMISKQVIQNCMRNLNEYNLNQ